MRFVDLFCGIGGFHAAFESEFLSEEYECVFACDIDKDCREVYKENWEETPVGDIRKFAPNIEDHEILCAGFPCQPFSKSGSRLGFRDKVRGTLFGEISRIIESKRPKFVLLENVENLEGHDEGRTLYTIKRVLRDMGYFVKDKVLSPHHFGIPHHRPRIFIAAINKASVSNYKDFRFPRRLSKRSQDRCHVDSLFDVGSEGSIKDSEQKILDHWTEFMRRLPSDEKPPSPTWSMEFGRSYSLDGIHPISGLTKARLCEELSKEGIDAKEYWTKDTILGKFPPYIRKMKGEMPKWKRQIILRNRSFWTKHSGLFSDGWLEATGLFNETHQKFEWHLGADADRDVMSHMIHSRPSGIRVSKMNRIPALVAMAQIPIIGPWRRRLSPREAANAQSFDQDFELDDRPGVAFKQLGNSVNVSVVARILRGFEKLVIGEELEQKHPVVVEFQRSNR